MDVKTYQLSIKNCKGASSTGGSNTVVSEAKKVIVECIEGQTSITIPFEFTEETLKIYRNGVLQNIEKDYTIIEDTAEFTIQFTDSDLVTLIIDYATVITNENSKYKVDYEYDSTGAIIKEIYSGDIKRTVTYEYDENGNVTKKKVLKDGKTKEAVYSYDENGNIISLYDNGTEDAFITLSSNCSGGSGDSSKETIDRIVAIEQKQKILSELLSQHLDLQIHFELNESISVEYRITELERQINEIEKIIQEHIEYVEVK